MVTLIWQALILEWLVWFLLLWHALIHNFNMKSFSSFSRTWPVIILWYLLGYQILVPSGVTDVGPFLLVWYSLVSLRFTSYCHFYDDKLWFLLQWQVLVPFGIWGDAFGFLLGLLAFRITNLDSFWSGRHRLLLMWNILVTFEVPNCSSFRDNKHVLVPFGGDNYWSLLV